jgi:branched-chain amino acid transport system permease protein
MTPKSARIAVIVAALCLSAALLMLPLFARTTFTYLLIDFFIMALFAASYNVVFGMTGLLSFCHATFYGAGAYAVAMSVSLFGTSAIFGLVFAPILAATLAAAIGWLAVRTKGIQFAMLTLALGQLVYTIVVRQYNLTGGEDGLPIAAPAWLASPVTLYYLALVVCALCLWILWRVQNSPFGTALAAIRQNRQRAFFVGLNVKAYELAAFVLAGALAGVAGALRGIEQQAAYPTLFAWTQSAEPLLMTLAGGLNTFLGPVIGAGLFVALNFFVTKGFEYPLLVFGLVILVIVLVLPGGVASLFGRFGPAAGSRKA